MSSSGRLFQACVNTGFRGKAGEQESKPPRDIRALDAQERLQDHLASVNTAPKIRGPSKLISYLLPQTQISPKLQSREGRHGSMLVSQAESGSWGPSTR